MNNVLMGAGKSVPPTSTPLPVYGTMNYAQPMNNLSMLPSAVQTLFNPSSAAMMQGAAVNPRLTASKVDTGGNLASSTMSNASNATSLFTSLQPALGQVSSAGGTAVLLGRSGSVMPTRTSETMSGATSTPSAAPSTENQKTSTEAQVQQLLELLTKVQEQSRAANANSSHGTGANSQSTSSNAQSLPGVMALMPHLTQLSQLVQQGLQPQFQQQLQQPQPQGLHSQMGFAASTPIGMNMGLGMGMNMPMASMQPGMMMPPPPPPPMPPMPPVPPASLSIGGGQAYAAPSSLRAPLPPQQETLLAQMNLTDQQRSYIESKSMDYSYDRTKYNAGDDPERERFGSATPSDKQGFNDNRAIQYSNSGHSESANGGRADRNKDWDRSDDYYKRRRDDDAGDDRSKKHFNYGEAIVKFRREESNASDRNHYRENENHHGRNGSKDYGSSRGSQYGDVDDEDRDYDEGSHHRQDGPYRGRGRGRGRGGARGRGGFNDNGRGGFHDRGRGGFRGRGAGHKNGVNFRYEDRDRADGEDYTEHRRRDSSMGGDGESRSSVDRQDDGGYSSRNKEWVPRGRGRSRGRGRGRGGSFGDDSY
ncbi:hypothetical protein BC939DRAFT_117020 [Gamsiella multidivaricata]|uniref:uncharacterized protein n=1 Tax=Gamsiella multidivaricata TaxID=101098 RepID=UPI0022207F08|nr:uncharacterized protein BC939DRAFT_117020 [Gamsiella multidivaricata]KAI7826217.1 hypothetical protein BC939DRAFT_117020 [Gamsiella multidivaricata]